MWRPPPLISAKKARERPIFVRYEMEEDRGCLQGGVLTKHPPIKMGRYSWTLPYSNIPAYCYTIRRDGNIAIIHGHAFLDAEVQSSDRAAMPQRIATVQCALPLSI